MCGEFHNPNIGQSMPQGAQEQRIEQMPTMGLKQRALVSKIISGRIKATRTDKLNEHIHMRITLKHDKANDIAAK